MGTEDYQLAETLSRIFGKNHGYGIYLLEGEKHVVAFPTIFMEIQDSNTPFCKGG